MRTVFIFFLALSCSQVPSESIPKYQRQQWKHWTDQDRNCLNTRAEILKLRSVIPVKMNHKGCSVVSGLWHDYYFPETHTKAHNIDIDHLVSLKNAHQSGGSHWSMTEKETFANDPTNLVITNRSYNRKKGAKGIDQWLPVEKNYACKYAKDWYKVKNKYNLKISNPEMATLDTLRLNGCAIF